MTPQDAIKWVDGKMLEIVYELEVTKSEATPIDDNEFGLNVSSYKVIGNIHDNPELLNKEVNENGMA